MPTHWQLVLRSRRVDPLGPTPAVRLYETACAILARVGVNPLRPVLPFTIAPVTPGTEPGTWLLDLSWLDDSDVPEVERHTGESVRLGERELLVERVVTRFVPYGRLVTLPPERTALVTFRSPTSLSRGFRQVPLPDPRLLLVGLVERWFAFADQPLRIWALRELHDEIHLAGYHLRTAKVPLGPTLRTGFTGWAELAVPSTAPDDVAAAFTALLAFAELAGSGDLTSHGLGRTATSVHPADPQACDTLGRWTSGSAS